MECLEGYTVGDIKKLSREELLVLWNIILEEKQTHDIRNTICGMVEVIEANKQ